MEFADRFKAIARLAPEQTAVEFQGRDHDWGWLRRVADAVEALLIAAGVAPAVPVGWMAHNRPDMVGAALGLLQSGRYLAPVNPHQPAARLTEEVRDLAMAAQVGLAEDWRAPDFVDAARAAGALGILVDIDADVPARLVPALETLGPGPHRATMPGYAMERMSSGTTGRPKRVPLKLADLEEGLLAGPPTREDAEAAKAGEVRRSASPAIMFNPFAHAGGIYGLVGALYFGRTISLHEKFEVAEWSAAVRRFRAPVANLVPAMLRMVLDAEVPREALASLIAVRSGTAPLDPETQKLFEDRYGIPILIDYGASEFIGGVAGWSLRDHRQFGAAKRGSVGRAKAGVALRVTDDDRAELAVGETGILEIRSDRFGPDWIRTTDLAAIDSDGFLFIRGRADGVIIRGGFKIIPEVVGEILQRHPAVNEAVVLGVKDERLGELPLAVVELRAGAARPAPQALDAFLREHLPPYQVPAAYEFVETLPRTVSLKIARPEVRAMLAGRYAFA